MQIGQKDEQDRLHGHALKIKKKSSNGHFFLSLGLFEHGLSHGPAFVLFETGESWLGDFEKDNMTHAIATYDDGNWYKGEHNWETNECEGEGAFFWNDGDFFCGQ